MSARSTPCRKQKTLSKTYAPTSQTEYLPTLNVNVDFTSRGIGIFTCYIVGHHHGDVVAVDANGQKIMQLDTTSTAAVQRFRSDLPIVANTQSSECITLIGINTDDRLIKFVRIGSRVTTNMRKRETLCWSY